MVLFVCCFLNHCVMPVGSGTERGGILCGFESCIISNACATATTTKSNSNATTTPTAKAVGNGGRNLRESLKTKLMALENDFLLQRLPSVMKKKQRCQRRRKLKEEEQAAVCLMALSCGSVFA
ncbi:gata transcription factor 16 [Quercus suber]|uniref:Gata transcription factor 16 n=1 Tax=Quercus suber TaxID=58331 RepID=A0AAW0IK76_QUESU